jgi:hypothetical protein
LRIGATDIAQSLPRHGFVRPVDESHCEAGNKWGDGIDNSWVVTYFGQGIAKVFEPAACHTATDRDRCVPTRQARTPLLVEVCRNTAEPRLKKELLPLAFPFQVTIERWAENSVCFDTVVQPIDKPSNSHPATKCLKRSNRREQWREPLANAASVIKAGLNCEWS